MKGQWVVLKDDADIVFVGLFNFVHGRDYALAERALKLAEFDSVPMRPQVSCEAESTGNLVD